MELLNLQVGFLNTVENQISMEFVNYNCNVNYY